MRRVLPLLAMTVAFGVSLYFMQQLIPWTSPWMGLLLMMIVLGLARMADPIYALKMPPGLREVQPWELQGHVYRSLAVPQFGSLLRDTPLRWLNTSVYLTRGRPDPARVCRQLEAAEASHFWSGFVLVPYLALYAWSGWWAVIAGLLIVEIVGHLYPILHLRWARGRLERVQRRHRLTP